MTTIIKTIKCPFCGLLAGGRQVIMGDVERTLYKCRNGHITPESDGRPAMGEPTRPIWQFGNQQKPANEGGDK